MKETKSKPWKQPAEGTGRTAWGAVPLHLMRHQFKPGMASMKRMAKGPRAK